MSKVLEIDHEFDNKKKISVSLGVYAGAVSDSKRLRRD